jgi:hypothetical protein
MRLHIVNKEMCAPGGWRYRQPETGYVMQSIVWEELVRRVASHRVANGIAVAPGWEVRLEHDVCEQAQHGGRVCQYTTDATAANRPVNRSDVLNFLRVAANWLPNREWVPQEEADRRAGICAKCPLNIKADGCASCRNLVGEVVEFLGARTTSHDRELEACGVCGCSNKAQVHIPMTALAKGVSADMAFPEWCWKREAVVG